MHFKQKVGRRNKIGVKDGDEFALRRFQSFRQSARLEALTIVAVQVRDRMSQGGVALDQKAGDLNGFVGRVVEQLDVELFSADSRAGRRRRAAGPPRIAR